MFKIHDFNNDKFDQWLPWGGITHEHVLHNKDESLLGVIRYNPLPSGEHVSIEEKNVFPDFIMGWSIWTDKQHIPGQDAYYIAICWNPFFNKKGMITNTLSDEYSSFDEYERYFESVLVKIADRLSAYTECQLLNYQGIYNYLSFVISIGNKYVKMPDIPMYMDADFSSFVKVDFPSNSITIDDQRIVMINLPSVPDDELYMLFDFFTDINYRYSRRLLFMDKTAAEKDLEKYTNKWCPGRDSIKDVITDSILSDVNGYFYNAFIFLIDKSDYIEFIKLVRKATAKLGLVNIVESFNLKDSWWGCIPGCYSANITPPVMGFDSVLDLLLHKEVEVSGSDVQA